MTVTVTSKTEVLRTEDVTELDVSAEALIAEFNSTKSAIKALEVLKASTEALIRGMLGSTEVGTINGVERVRIAHRSLTKVDRDLLKTAFPEAFEAVMVQSPYTVLQAK